MDGFGLCGFVEHVYRRRFDEVFARRPDHQGAVILKCLIDFVPANRVRVSGWHVANAPIGVGECDGFIAR